MTHSHPLSPVPPGHAVGHDLALAGCSLGPGGPPHPGAANPYSSGGFHDAGPNYPDTGL